MKKQLFTIRKAKQAFSLVLALGLFFSASGFAMPALTGGETQENHLSWTDFSLLEGLSDDFLLPVMPVGPDGPDGPAGFGGSDCADMDGFRDDRVIVRVSGSANDPVNPRP